MFKACFEHMNGMNITAVGLFTTRKVVNKSMAEEEKKRELGKRKVLFQIFLEITDKSLLYPHKLILLPFSGRKELVKIYNR